MRVATALMLFLLGLACSGLAWAQPTSAPQWCVDVLNGKPSPTPIGELYERVNKVIQPKGEFETTADFTARAERALSSLRVGRLVVHVPAVASYDADKGRFDVGLISLMPITGLNDFRTKTFAHVEYELVATEGRHRSSGEYEAENAYGVKRTISTEVRDQYGVALVNLSAAKKTSWLRGPVLIDMKPDRASAIGGKLGVMIIGELTPPGTLEGISRIKPTLQNPRDVVVHKHYVTMNASCGAITAMGTSEVVRRLN